MDNILYFKFYKEYFGYKIKNGAPKIQRESFGKILLLNLFWNKLSKSIIGFLLLG